MDWYYANERDEQIQVSEEELKALAEGGTIRPDSLVWNESMSDWKPCREMKPEWFSPAERSAPTALAASGPVAAAPQAATAPMAQQPPAHYRTAQPTDGLALTSLICSIAGLAFMSCYGAGLPFSIAGVICGHLCRRRLVAQGNNTSAGLALAGLIIGYVGIGLVLIFVLVIVVFFGMAAATSTSITPTPMP